MLETLPITGELLRGGWVGLGVIADNLINIARAANKKSSK
jgi:hypothetical protein